jgi:hypothetical protein
LRSAAPIGQSELSKLSKVRRRRRPSPYSVMSGHELLLRYCIYSWAVDRFELTPSINPEYPHRSQYYDYDFSRTLNILLVLRRRFVSFSLTHHSPHVRSL